MVVQEIALDAANHVGCRRSERRVAFAITPEAERIAVGSART